MQQPLFFATNTKRHLICILNALNKIHERIQTIHNKQSEPEHVSFLAFNPDTRTIGFRENVNNIDQYSTWNDIVSFTNQYLPAYLMKKESLDETVNVVTDITKIALDIQQILSNDILNLLREPMFNQGLKNACTLPPGVHQNDVAPFMPTYKNPSKLFYHLALTQRPHTQQSKSFLIEYLSNNPELQQAFMTDFDMHMQQLIFYQYEQIKTLHTAVHGMYNATSNLQTHIESIPMPNKKNTLQAKIALFKQNLIHEYINSQQLRENNDLVYDLTTTLEEKITPILNDTSNANIDDIINTINGVYKRLDNTVNNLYQVYMTKNLSIEQLQKAIYNTLDLIQVYIREIRVDYVNDVYADVYNRIQPITNRLLNLTPVEDIFISHTINEFLND